MILILRITLPLFGFKQIVPCHQLKYRACKTPHVSRLVILPSEAHLGRAILSRLYDVRELIVNVAGVAHVNQFHSELQRYNTL